MSRLSALSPPALLGIAVAILLLLGLSVVALRSGAEEPVASTSAEPGAGATDGPSADAGDPAGDAAEDDGSAAPTAPEASPAAGGEAPAEDAPAEPPAEDAAPAADIALPPGTCVNDDGRAANTAGVAVVDCATAHTGEVHAATTVTGAEGAPYPGQGVLQADSQAFCQGQAFEDYIGTSYAETRFFVYWLVPTEESWAAGDRDVACIFYDVRGLMTGSQRGTRQ